MRRAPPTLSAEQRALAREIVAAGDDESRRRGLTARLGLAFAEERMHRLNDGAQANLIAALAGYLVFAEEFRLDASMLRAFLDTLVGNTNWAAHAPHVLRQAIETEGRARPELKIVGGK